MDEVWVDRELAELVELVESREYLVAVEWLLSESQARIDKDPVPRNSS